MDEAPYWPNPATLAAELRAQDRKRRYGEQPVSEWPRRDEKGYQPVVKPARLDVASDREMLIHARQLAAILEAKALNRSR